MTEQVFLVRSRLTDGVEWVERKDDIGLVFDVDPSPALIAARITCVLLGLEPHCHDVDELTFSRIA